jgi:hypothetical protein
MKNVWGGHSAVTRWKLLAILERAAEGGDDFSISERALYVACEFWAAVRARTLRVFLGPAAAEQLRYVAIVYSAIGAVEVAREVKQALHALSLADTSSQCAQCVASLQERLRLSNDPLDDLITRFAQRLH